MYICIHIHGTDNAHLKITVLF